MSLDSGINLFVLYKFIKELSTPFKDTKAFELGLVDEKGKLLKKAKTKKEKEAYSYFFRFIFNLKRLLSKVGLQSQLGTFAAAMFLLKEEYDQEWSDKELLDEIYQNMMILKEDPNLMEEIMNATGPAIAGTGSDTAHWYDPKKRKGRPKEMRKPINGVTYLKRVAIEAAKRGNN
jgi:hypothetical protein